MKSFIKNCAIVMIVFVSSLGISVSVFAQAPDTAWTKTIGGADGDNSRSIQQTTDGGYILTGTTTSFGAGNQDIYLIKTDSIGDTLWTKTYGDTGYDVGFSVQQTTDGGYIITGTIIPDSISYMDVYLVKTDSMGDTLWTKTYGDSGYDSGSYVQQTFDGGYIVAGVKYSFSPNYSTDVYLIKTDSLGDTLWTKTYGGADSDRGNYVQQTIDGGYIITGWTYSYGAGSADVYLIKTDSLGDTLWTKTYGGVNGDGGGSVLQTVDGNYIVAGGSYSYGAGSADVYLIKTDSLGDTLWTKTYGDSGYDESSSVQQTTDGGYIIVGYTESYGAGSADVYIIKVDSLGDTLWTKTLGGAEYDVGWSIQQTTDGGYIVAGQTKSYGAGSSDAYIIKLESESGLEEEITPNVFYIYQPTPNPFFCSTMLRYELLKEIVVTVDVLNILGQKVKKLDSGRKSVGIHRLTWHGRDDSGNKLPSGFYFIRLKAGEYNGTRKLLLIK